MGEPEGPNLVFVQIRRTGAAAFWPRHPQRAVGCQGSLGARPRSRQLFSVGGEEMDYMNSAACPRCEPQRVGDPTQGSVIAAGTVEHEDLRARPKSQLVCERS